MLSHVYPGFHRTTVYELSVFQKHMELYSSNAGIFGKRRNTGNSCSSKNTGDEQTIPDDVLYLCSAVTVCIGTDVFADVFYTVERAAGRGYQCTDV